MMKYVYMGIWGIVFSFNAKFSILKKRGKVCAISATVGKLVCKVVTLSSFLVEVFLNNNISKKKNSDLFHLSTWNTHAMQRDLSVTLYVRKNLMIQSETFKWRLLKVLLRRLDNDGCNQIPLHSSTKLAALPPQNHNSEKETNKRKRERVR